MAVAEERDSAVPAACPPCQGTGKVLSQLGGTPAQAVCPWCEGGGVPIPEHDAQAARIAARAAG